MTRPNRFHPVYSLAILKKPAIVCVVPLLAALRDFDLPALLRALRQEFALLALLLVLGFLLWRQAGWWMENETLCWRRGFFGPAQQSSLSQKDLAWAAVYRAWYLRPIGAVRLELGLTSGENLHLFLPRRTAEELADTLLPMPPAEHDLTPTPGEKALLALMNCDLLATVLLLAVSFRNSARLLGRRWTDQLAAQGLSAVMAPLVRWMPPGLALIAALLFLLGAATLALGFLRTANCTLQLGGGCIRAAGGILSPTTRVIRQSAVLCADLRATPVSRLTGRYPLGITAGGYTVGALLLCRGFDDPRLPLLLPGIGFAPAVRQNTRGRSLPAFLLLPAIGTAVSLGVFLFFLRFTLLVPIVAPLLALPVLLCLGWLWVGIEGRRYDRAARTAEGLPTVSATALFTHHHVCVFRAASLTLAANPFSRKAGRCNLTLRMPKKRVTVKSVVTAETAALRDMLTL